jgi:hypothetical protein
MHKVSDILARFYPDYMNRYTPSTDQSKAVTDIMRCKTAALGAHVYECQECGHQYISYNS